jgi:N-succinyldiaminopimelate aminotransferase
MIAAMAAGGTTIFTTMTALAQATGAINLGQGYPDFDGPPALIEAAVEALRGGENQYAPLAGVPALRAAIAAHQLRRYGLRFDADSEIQVTFGATEALASALLALVTAGDEVAMLDPSYDSYGPIVALAGGRAVPIVLEPPGWRVDGAALERAITTQTRVVIINSPHNPTGRVFERSELELIAAACREHDLIALTDEVYEHLVYDGEHIPLATLPGMASRTITVSSIGKTHSVTGWKIGWACGPRELIARLRAVKQYLTFAGGTPLQHASAVALGFPDSVAAELADALRAKRDRLAGGLRAAGFDVFDSAGTYFLNADATPLGEGDAEALCARLPHEAGVAAIPMSALTANGHGRTRSLLRFAFCKRDEVLDDAIGRLNAWAERSAIPSPAR